MDRIAIACSGLGHIRRGVEAWAADLAGALKEAGVPVTLFGAVPGAADRIVPCLRRGERGTARLLRLLAPIGGWRFGAGSAYELEQTSFALALLPRLRGVRIVHTQDAHLGLALLAARRLGLHGAEVILANGTGEEKERLGRFATVQHLTPAAMDAAAPALPRTRHVQIPNAVDARAFRPGDRAAARAALGLPADAPVILCCSAVRRRHKRIDALLRAFARLEGEPHLLLVGAREADTDAVLAEGIALLGPRLHVRLDQPRNDLARFYHAADAFVLASLAEPFGIVLLEALACGLPVLTNDTADLRYVAGPGGLARDIADEAGLAAALADLLRPARRAALSAGARAHVLARFDAPVVARQTAAMYRAVLSGDTIERDRGIAARDVEGFVG